MAEPRTSDDVPYRARHRAAAPSGPGGPPAGGRRPRRWRRATVAVAVMCAAGLSASAGQASAATRPDDTGRHRPPAPSVPAIIQPPAGLVEVATYRVAFGVQIYTCTAGAWVFKAPEAHLINAANPWRWIHHFAGPSWQSRTDNSLLTAGKLAESPVAGAIPQLLLGVKTHTGDPNGELGRVSHIQRLNTRGGLAPTGPCRGTRDLPVPYYADYVLFAPR